MGKKNWFGLKLIFLLALALTFGFAGCEQSGGDAAESAESNPAPQASVQVPEPDTTARAVWAHIQEKEYRSNWDFWPGRTPYYQGTEPHGALLSTYLNGPALRGLLVLREENGVADLPAGSIIVKENYTPDTTLAAVTVMYKAEGYDPAHDNWWWMKRLADGTVEAAGQVSSCIQCHEAARDVDYLMTQFHEDTQE